MKNWIRLACLTVGAALAFGSAAESEQASGTGTAPSVRTSMPPWPTATPIL